jgi:hypothetical protein
VSDRSTWTPIQVEFHEFLAAANGLALRSGPDLYPGVQLALDALPWLEERSIVVLGCDGLDTDGQWIRPRLDRIADFSGLLDKHSEWRDRVRLSLHEARRLLTEWLGDVQFVDFALVAEDEVEALRAYAARLSS